MMKPEALARAEKACGRRSCRRAQSGYSLRGLVQSTGLSVGVGAGPTAIVQRQGKFPVQLYKPRPTQGRQGLTRRRGRDFEAKMGLQSLKPCQIFSGRGAPPPCAPPSGGPPL